MVNQDKDLFFKPRWGFAWYPAYDKLGHFICHYFAMRLTVLLFASLPLSIFGKLLGFGGKILIAWLIWFLIGLLYEFWYDVRKGRRPSWKDIVANEIGHLVGAIC